MNIIEATEKAKELREVAGNKRCPTIRRSCWPKRIFIKYSNNRYHFYKFGKKFIGAILSPSDILSDDWEAFINEKEETT